MILRSVSQNVRDQNWFAVGIDFAIVVIGVFIGIQVANWNEMRTDRRTGDEYVARLTDELDAVADRLGERIVYADWVVEHTTRALDRLEHRPETLDSEFIDDLYIAGHSVTANIQRDTYNEMIAVGALGKISDYSLRERIQQFYGSSLVMDRLAVSETSFQREFRRAMPHDVILVLRDNCGRGMHRVRNQAPLPDRSTACGSGLSIDQIDRTLTSIESADLKASLREALSDYRVKRSRMIVVLERAQSLKSALQATT